METMKQTTLFDTKITAFGHGSMGSGTINILLEQNIIDRNKYTAIVRSEASVERLNNQKISATTTRNKEAICSSDIVVLAYKQDGLRSEQVYENMEGKIIISLIAGITSEEISTKFPSAKIARAMPNRGSVVADGCTFVKFAENFSEDERDLVCEFFEASGDVHEVTTTHEINQGTILSASMVGVISFFRDKIHNTLEISREDIKSRDFFKKFNDIVAQLAQKYDFIPEYAQAIAEKTFQGTGSLAQKYDYQNIQASVTSKNGTTHAMIEYLKSIDIEAFLSDVFAQEYVLEQEKQQKFAGFLEQAYLKGMQRAEEMAKK